MQAILLIEKTSGIFSNLRIYLEMEGYTILNADDGEKAFEIAEEYMPDLIICDVSIHEMGGYDVLRIMKKSPKTAIIPFILCTSKPEKIDVAKAINLGADNCIEKPYDTETLLEVIRSQIKKARSLTLHL